MTNHPIKAPEGWWEEGVFHFPFRCYYEDTDVGGMVYHARYVSFFERVRTESIRGTAMDVDALMARPEADGGPLVYVVSKIDITYRQQSKLGDVLLGHTMAKKVRAAAVEARQWITREGEVVADANVLIAIVDQQGRPNRWPADAKAAWSKVQADAENGHYWSKFAV